MRTDRLQTLANHLRRIDKGFDLAYLVWGSSKVDLFGIRQILQQNSGGVQPNLFSVNDCKTSACAIGNLPLLFEEWDYGRDLAGDICLMYMGESGNWCRCAEHFFEIFTKDVIMLFSPESYDRSDDPVVVANRIESFITRSKE